MRRWADAALALLPLQGLGGIWFFVFLTLLFSLFPFLLVLYFGEPLGVAFEAASQFTGLALIASHTMVIAMASGELARLGHSLRRPGLVELFLSRGIDASEVFSGLWVSSSLRFLLFMAVSGLVADLVLFEAGKISLQEAVLFIAGLAISTSLIAAIAVLLSLFIPPGEAQYWISWVLYLSLGWFYQRALLGWLNSDSLVELSRLIISGFADPKVLAGGAVAVLVTLVMLIAVSGELSWEGLGGEEGEDGGGSEKTGK